MISRLFHPVRLVAMLLGTALMVVGVFGTLPSGIDTASIIERVTPKTVPPNGNSSPSRCRTCSPARARCSTA